jgi:hypothetical protein
MLPKTYQPDGFPACISLSIEFNQHATYYQTIEQWEADRVNCSEVEWVSDDERRKAIETDNVWECHWSPKTPVGSCSLAASSFKALMRAVNDGAD